VVGFGSGRTWRSIMMSDGERLHRLGGAPSWVECAVSYADGRMGQEGLEPNRKLHPCAKSGGG
jgi:hypothetical protein